MIFFYKDKPIYLRVYHILVTFTKSKDKTVFFLHFTFNWLFIQLRSWKTSSGIYRHLKLSHCEKATELEKNYHLFWSVLSSAMSKPVGCFSNFCGLFRKPKLYLKTTCCNEICLFRPNRINSNKNPVN